jgi:hypothetical protein
MTMLQCASHIRDISLILTEGKGREKGTCDRISPQGEKQQPELIVEIFLEQGREKWIKCFCSQEDKGIVWPASINTFRTCAILAVIQHPLFPEK